MVTESAMSIEKILAIIALAGVLLGPLVQLVIAKAQIRAEVRSGNRQQWINELRNEISEFMTANIDYIFRLRFAKEATSDILSTTNSVWQHLNKTQLLINPNDNDHKELIELMNDAALAANSRELDIDTMADTLDDLNEKITIVAQRIMKREWERVKSGD
jgi:Mg/Co/Ni transporter MgtE